MNVASELQFITPLPLTQLLVALPLHEAGNWLLLVYMLTLAPIQILSTAMRPEKALENLITQGHKSIFRFKMRTYVPAPALADTWGKNLISHAIARNSAHFINVIIQHPYFVFTPACLALVFEALNQNKPHCISAILGKYDSNIMAIDSRTEDGKTALRLAIDKNHVDAAFLLLHHGANPHAICNEDAHTPLSSLIQSSPDSDQKEALIIAMMSKTAYKMETDIAFLTVLETGKPSLFTHLLTAETNPALLSRSLLLAKQKGINDAVTMLKKHGAIYRLPTINPKELTITDQFTSGGMSNISHAYFNNKDVIIKSVPPEYHGEHEAHILLKAQHPHIIALHGVIDRGPHNDYWLVMEYMRDGDLEEYLRRHPRDNDATQRTVQGWMHNIANALIFLHACAIIHSDISCSNILIDEVLCAKLCDFGISMIQTEHESTKLNIPRKYSPCSAPEVVDPNAVITSAADIYSFAVVLCVCASEHAYRPYTQANLSDIPRLISLGTIPVTPPPRTSAVLETLLHDSMKKTPSLRPTASDLAERLKIAFPK